MTPSCPSPSTPHPALQEVDTYVLLEVLDIFAELIQKYSGE